MIPEATRTGFTEEHALFRASVRQFVAAQYTPHLDRWEADGLVDRDFWQCCGAMGLIAPQVREADGGAGLDYRFNAIVAEEMGYSGQLNGVVLQSDVIVPYVAHYGSAELRATWLPGLLSGETIAAIAMTEPGAGSDLQGIRTAARRDGDDYVISGSKLFITNGIQADVVVLVARTDPAAGSKGISLILVETDRPGFERGRKLDKVGNRSADTAELFLHEVRVPAGNVLGEGGRGFAYLMEQLPQERLSIAVAAQAGAQRAFDETVEYVRTRPAFGKTVLDFQNTRFTLAQIKAQLQAGWAHLDWAIARHVAGQLTAAEASAAKLWHSEMQWQVVDACLQLHGGAGYMNDYPIARLWRDARVQRIYGGTSEIMREVIGRTL